MSDGTASGRLAALGVAERREALRSGACSVTDLVAATLEQLASRAGALRALAGPVEPGALEVARAADRRLADGRPARPLEGTTFLVKDNIAQAGRPVRAGTDLVLLPAGPAAPALTALEEAGAILVGRAAMSPWAIGATGADALAGEAPANLAFPGRVPGGSSSGSGTAVAAGLVPIALGTDTGGSVRIPAAAQEIYGLRPTRAAISTEGVYPVAAELDVVGPLARTVADLAAAASALLPDTLGPRAPLRRVAFDPTPDLDARPETALLVRRAAERLALAGLDVRQVSLRGPTAARAAAATLLQGEAAELHAERLHSGPRYYSPTTLARLRAGSDTDATRRRRARRVAERWREEIDGLLGDFDALLVPALPSALPSAGGPESGDRVREMGALMLPFSLIDGPALVAPSERVAPDLAGAVQLAGRPWEDAALVELAALLQ